MNSKLQTARTAATMFLPVIGYYVGQYLTEHWEVAKQIEVTLAPYAFSTSMVFGLIIGLAQLGYAYKQTRKLSSYVLQQLSWLLAYTCIPLYFGHFVGVTPTDPIGYNVIGLVGMSLAAVYAVDFCTGMRLILAFPRHFNPETAALANKPGFRRTMGHIELALVAMFTLKGAFLVFGKRWLSTPEYLAIMPFVVNGLLLVFLTFVSTYPAWAKRQAEKRAAEAAAATPEATPAAA